ncbi:hypothetical protein DSO57_1022134 [Entomophthora muscae]|uniref:Uncharacterized protein n=1 Tax=Entomophthora muscae TaxID=34485 RepID=A0ACC2UE13_9FUNG|nr:hypothetical protein DSO57_1022134 [Entomophthora muscae]
MEYITLQRLSTHRVWLSIFTANIFYMRLKSIGLYLVQGFPISDLANIGRVGVGICMDLNHNTKDDGSFSKCEFAKYHAEQQTNLVMVPMNWLKSWEVDDSLPSTMTLLYWITRLKPLIDSLKPGQRVFVVACNRIGTERGTTFTGTSCILELSLSNSNQEESKLLDLIKETADIISRLSERNPDFSRKYDEMIAMATQAFDLLDKVQLIGSLSTSFEGLLECYVPLDQSS